MRTQANAATQQLHAAQKQAEIARQQFETDSAIRERAQAESVAGWTETSLGDDGEENLHVVLQNTSSAPVYDVRFAVFFPNLKGDECRYAGSPKFLPPTGKENEWNEIAAGAQEYWKHEWLKRRKKNRRPLVELLFHDSTGAAWIRSHEGVLSEYRGTKKYPDYWTKSGGRPLIGP
ncbi:hypothetical protein FEF26_04835 [Nesterenkonia salmonea]|uniref:Uncharacterized protein n=1 Tax=Nesterenkonia salmonea TaxID=1804987 RepID=A0A5R9BCZ2_9MICC|nr:hypothetical protein [Nesterenkonia salmonea]TLP98486.1 hypothetical protein FEF26_04835 [Nesterenkonia salmonea]